MKNNDVQVVVILGGPISSKKGINLPDTKISLPALTEKDLVDLEFIIAAKAGLGGSFICAHGKRHGYTSETN